MLIDVHFVPDDLMPGQWVYAERPDGSHVVLIAREAFPSVTAEQARECALERLAAAA